MVWILNTVDVNYMTALWKVWGGTIYTEVHTIAVQAWEDAKTTHRKHEMSEYIGVNKLQTQDYTSLQS